MDTATDTSRNKRRHNGAGAQSAGAQDNVVKLDPIKDTIAELVRLARSAKDAAAQFSEALEAAATKSGARLSTVRKFVLARAGDKFADRKAECEQLAFLFDRVGE